MLQESKPTYSQVGWVIAALLLAISGSTAQPAAPAQQRTLALEGGTLIDGTGRAPITDAVIVIEGNRIKAVGRRGQVRIPAGATVIKTDGRTILPGLIDSHTHTRDYYMPMFLHYGVTTIQDKWNDPAWVVAEREGLRNGTIKGPRMFIGGENLVRTEFSGMASHPAATVEEARADARSLVANGVDIINVDQSLTDDQLRAVVQVANEAGLPVMGHTNNPRRAAAVGYKFQEHMWSIPAGMLDPEEKTTIGLGRDSFAPEALMDPKAFPPLIDYLASHGVFINPTLVSQWSTEAPRGRQLVEETSQLAKDPQLAFVPAAIRETWNDFPSEPRQGYANVAEFLKEYAAAGGKVVVGTDTSGPTIGGLAEHYEMQMLVDVGIPPMKVIQGATLWNAQLMMKDKDLGSVEPGKLADLLIIEGDPLADISATKNVRLVIKDGAVVDTKYDPKYVNPIPAPGVQGSRPPEITKVSPVARQGGPTVTLQIEGRGGHTAALPFNPNSVVRFDNVDLPTQFVSGTKLTATLDAKLLQRSPGFYPLYVVSPGLHGTVSSVAYEVIDTADAPVNTVPVSYKMYADNSAFLFGPSPRMAPQGGQTVTLTIEGTKFAANSVFNPKAGLFASNAVVRFDNVDLPTHFVSSTKLTATLDAKLLQRSPGSYLVYVVNPGLYGNVSQEGHFMVLPKNSKAVWNYSPD